MNLGWIEARLNRRIDAAEIHLANLLGRATSSFNTTQELYELEGWLSDVWQFWCRFCRRVVMESCSGCQTTSGTIHAQSHSSPAAVSFIAAKQKNGVPPSTIGSNAVLRIEPTWGHIDKLLDVINALNPPNRPALLGAFGTIPLIEHIRLIRNASAHRNTQTLADVLAFQSQYKGSSIRHPLQALFWHEVSSNQTLIQARLDDMRIGARNACT